MLLEGEMQRFFLLERRQVRISDGASLYSLSRSWLRNGDHEGIQDVESVKELSENDLLKRHIEKANQ
ncbi:unnamed protein product, partial [Brassica oleracea var. botrytis]